MESSEMRSPRENSMARTVFISPAFAFKPASVEGELTLQQAAAHQHPAIQALRGAMGWHEGAFSVEDFNALWAEESARIPEGGTWADYRRVNRAGSSFRLNRRTRAALFVAITTTRVIDRLT